MRAPVPPAPASAAGPVFPTTRDPQGAHAVAHACQLCGLLACAGRHAQGSRLQPSALHLRATLCVRPHAAALPHEFNTPIAVRRLSVVPFMNRPGCGARLKTSVGRQVLESVPQQAPKASGEAALRARLATLRASWAADSAGQLDESGGTAEVAEAAWHVQTAVAQLADLSELVSAVQQQAAGVEEAAAGRVAAASNKVWELVEAVDRLKSQALAAASGGGGGSGGGDCGEKEAAGFEAAAAGRVAAASDKLLGLAEAVDRMKAVVPAAYGGGGKEEAAADVVPVEGCRMATAHE